MAENNGLIKELCEKGVVAFVPGGNSMWPFLKNKSQSVIVIKKTERLKPWDMALFLRENGTMVLHRVLEVKENGYVICGDSQFSKEFVKEDNVYGVVKEFFHGKKTVDAHTPKYLRKVENWYRRDKRRRLRLKVFYFKLKVKNKLKKIFKKDSGDENV